MKISLAQIKPSKGNLTKNIQDHLSIIQRAVESGTDLIAFPELSLTGYEPTLAETLAREANDPIFNPFQNLADQNKVSIAVGMPLKTQKGIVIGMLIFQPDTTRTLYAKQILHEDELPYFVAGEKQVLINIKDERIAFGICYEALQRPHFLNAKAAGATIYLASVAKPKLGISKAYPYFSKIAAEFSMPVLMVNSVGFCDNFMAVGQTVAWNTTGALINQLDAHRPGILLIDLTTDLTKIQYFEITHENIQLAQSTDLPALIQLFQKAKVQLDQQKIFQWTDDYPSKINIDKDFKNRTLYLLKNAQELIGAVTLNEEQDHQYQTIDWKFGSNKVLVIHRLVVHPAYQGRGYAKQIMDFAEAYAIAQEYEAIRLDTYTQNKISFEFYKKRNYVLRGEVFFPGRPYPFYCLEKNLNPNFTE